MTIERMRVGIFLHHHRIRVEITLYFRFDFPEMRQTILMRNRKVIERERLGWITYGAGTLNCARFEPTII